MRRLAQASLLELARSVRRPCYDRAELRVGMAHIGVGAFHRCHQAEFTDDMLEARFGPWGVVGINLYPPVLAELLAPQDHLYSRTLRQGERAETRIVGSILHTVDVLDAATTDEATRVLASPSLHVVTMTVTEKGYGLVPASGALDMDNPQLRADLRGPSPPRTLLGLLALAMERRRTANAPPLTMVSCDNVPSNGTLLRSALIAFAAARSAPLARWIEESVAFPCSMVDRIVPAATREDIDRIAVDIGVIDEAAVVGEPFRQWVIEDRFAGDRPLWELAGAQLARDAKPYETIKMRVLNAAQSTLSHLGAIVGHEFSFEAAHDPVLLGLTRRMLQTETVSTLPTVEGMGVEAYIKSSLERIANSAIRHRCHQIGTDGSQKIVQRIVNPLRERLVAGQSAPLLTLAVAGWMAYVLSGAQRFGHRWDPSDPWAETVIAMGEECREDFSALARAVLGVRTIFGSDLATAPFVAAVGAHLRGLLDGDAAAYLAGLAGDK
ncbi:MAG: mannitol dehydrogenase family protein [Roseiarcus sp.]|uniref:mannitol dehydrogenase family protein n=1 Tax=Roseiarcus sp. TaxID=1969460 RepID=UPI003BB1AA96